MSDYRCRACGDYFCSCVRHIRTVEESRLMDEPRYILRKADRRFTDWFTKDRERATQFPIEEMEQYREEYQEAERAYYDYVNPSCPCKRCARKREEALSE